MTSERRAAQAEDDQNTGREDEPAPAGRTTAQVVTTALSLLLIALLAAAILYEGYGDRGDNPARIEAEAQLERAEQRGELWYIPIRVINRGDDTVEELVIAITVSRGKETLLETDSTIAQLGESAETFATLVLDEDPASLTIEALPETFQIAED